MKWHKSIFIAIVYRQTAGMRFTTLLYAYTVHIDFDFNDKHNHLSLTEVDDNKEIIPLENKNHVEL